jgi:hypothetical protein
MYAPICELVRWRVVRCGEWFLSRRDRLIVARHEVPVEFGRFQSVARSGQNNLAQGLPWVSRDKRFALTRHMNVRSMKNTRFSGLEMLKGLETRTRFGSKVPSPYRRISWPLQG